MPINPIEVVGGIAIGEGVGGAVADVVEPQLRDLKNTESAKHLKIPLPGEVVAEVIARSIDVPDFTPGDDYSYAGLSAPRRRVLEQLARRYPGLAEGIDLWRRGYANYANVSGWLNRQGLSDEIVRQMIGDGSVIPEPTNNAGHLFMERLTPAQIALGIVRSIIDDPGLMPVNLDTRGGAVPAYPVSSIDALSEALDGGFNREHLRVLVGEIGLPMSPQQAASAYFRKLILPGGDTFALSDYHRAILEGDVRPEWAAAILEQARQILTANQYAELELRGFLNTTERRKKTDQHGMSHPDSDLLFDLLGRSVNVHQITTGLARGGEYRPPPATLAEQQAGIPRVYLDSLKRGNLRPEYYDVAFANRYTYPSFFAIRGLLQGGVFNADQGYDILLEMGWKPALARTVADFYAVKTTGPPVDPLVKSAKTNVMTRIRTAYIEQRADDAQAQGWLTRLDVPATVQTDLLRVWAVARDVPYKALTAKQIKDAFQNLPLEWPRDKALAELEALGMEPEDAQTYLDE